MNHALLEKALNCPRLPSLPAIALQVIEMCRQEDLNIRQIATTISNDPALSTKILRTVNSSFYGLSQPVSTITHAMVILGLNSVRTLALGFTLVNNLRKSCGESYNPTALWQRSLYAAVAARSIAQRVGLAEQEESFLGGLLQDLGVMAMIATEGGEYAQLVGDVGDNHTALWKLERQKYNLDHTQVGQALAQRWRLPEILGAPIRWHEQPDLAPPAIKSMVRCVALGGRAADMLLARRGESAVAVTEFFRCAREWFEFDRTAASDILQAAGQGTREMAKLFEINAGPPKDVGVILAEANEVLLELSLKSQRNVSQLQQQNLALQEKATRDALTGAANRGHFNDFLAEHFDRAAERGLPISLILLDADRFKAFNDTHGHLAGDHVLISLAQALMQHSPAEALVARYGGEEFAVILPGLDRAEAASLAERLRREVAAMPITFEDRVLPVTASFGVASFDGIQFFKKPQQLIKAADQAVYAAKASGRNCVRVFTPRQPAAHSQA